jgi:all-trans-nonaprenyl-diphosphate synthase
MIFDIKHTDILVLQSRELTTEHQRLAEIIEMIHTASLIHDDVIDDSGMRRGM